MRILKRSTLVTTVFLAAVLGLGAAIVGAEAGGWGVGLAAGVVLGAGTLLVGLRSSVRRWRVAQTPLSSTAQAWIRDHIPLYRHLSPERRRRFDRDVQFVLDEFSFEGVGGVTVTDPLRWGVAAGAALLLHGRPDWDLPGTRSVLFYAGRFDDDYFVAADEYGSDYADYDGMAHPQGPIILTVPSVEESWDDPTEGNNVVLHELAHLFDFNSEGADGVPSLIAPGSVDAWQDLVQREMRRVRQRRSMLRPYAAEAPSEFFAVAVEHFFEEPGRMAEHHPDLFRALTAAFNLDPRDGSTPDPEVVSQAPA